MTSDRMVSSSHVVRNHFAYNTITTGDETRRRVLGRDVTAKPCSTTVLCPAESFAPVRRAHRGSPNTCKPTPADRNQCRDDAFYGLFHYNVDAARSRACTCRVSEWNTTWNYSIRPCALYTRIFCVSFRRKQIASRRLMRGANSLGG